MKKLVNLFSLTALAATVFLSGCSDSTTDPKPKPTVTPLAKAGYTTADATVAPGATVKVGWIANKGDAKLKSFAVTKDGAALASYNAGLPNTSISSDSYQDSAIFVAPASGVSTYAFTVTDNDGVTASFSIKLTVSADIETRTQVILGSQNNTGASTGQFYSVSKNAVYTLTNAKAIASAIDLVYAHRNTTSGNRLIAAPSSTDASDIYNVTGADKLSTWTKLNATQFYTLSSTDYDAISSKADIASKVSGTGTLVVKELVTGSTFGFMTEAGVKGVAKVIAVAGTSYTDVNNSITLEIKVGK